MRCRRGTLGRGSLNGKTGSPSVWLPANHIVFHYPDAATAGNMPSGCRPPKEYYPVVTARNTFPLAANSSEAAVSDFTVV